MSASPPSSEQSLRPSVITSSSVLPLPEFFSEAAMVHDCSHIDLMVLRPEDAQRFGLEGEKTAKLVADHYTRLRDGFDDLFQESEQKCPKVPLRLSALATYFPEVSSMEAQGGTQVDPDERRTQAKNALVNCVLLGRHLAPRYTERKESTCVVEMVCGSLLEPWEGTDPSGVKWTIQYKREHKIARLVQSLKEIRNTLADHLDQVHDGYAFALELEPGEAYVLNGKQPLLDVFKEIDRAGLDKLVGLNLDIAHFRIAEIEAAWLKDNGFVSRIVHAHIADHPPGMHTRDQALGTFTDVESCPNAFSDYIDLLKDRARAYTPGANCLLFTHAVALELEGCSRISWVHNSLPHLKRLLSS